MNVIAEKLLSEVDDEVFTLTVFYSILEYTKDDSAIDKIAFTLEHTLEKRGVTTLVTQYYPYTDQRQLL